jgi:hypothetical protein
MATIQLVSVPVGHSARTDAAYGMRRAQNRAGTVKQINSSYRSLASQAILFHENYTASYSLSAKFDAKYYAGKWYWRRKGDTVSVAVPGKSKHNYGTAFDVQQSSNLQGLLINHGAEHGFTRTIRSEPWHWEYNPANDRWRVNIQAFQKSLNVFVSNAWGDALDKAALALRQASKNNNYGDTTTERKYLQTRVGVTADGVIGHKTKYAVYQHVKELQKIMKALGRYRGAIDGRWGSGTESAFRTFRRIGHTD